MRLALVDLGGVARTVVELLGPKRSARRSHSRRTPNGPVCLELDDEKIKQVLINLVRNAIEASAPGGRIEGIAREAGELAELVVEDDGPGLPVEERIFEPFFTTKEVGTGLGLAIVHRIVMDHGGHVAWRARRRDPVPGQPATAPAARVSGPGTPSAVRLTMDYARMKRAFLRRDSFRREASAKRCDSTPRLAPRFRLLARLHARVLVS